MVASYVPMKGWFILTVVTCAAASILWLMAHSTPAVQRIGLVAFTNGVLGVISPVFITNANTNISAAFQSWLALGTNGVIFTVTNEHRFPINLFPVARILQREGTLTENQTPLLNAPDWLGIRVQPYQVATVQVAVLPHQGPWKIELGYHRDVNSYSSLEEYLPSWAGGIPDQRGAPAKTFRTEWRKMESEWIEK